MSDETLEPPEVRDLACTHHTLLLEDLAGHQRRRPWICHKGRLLLEVVLHLYARHRNLEVEIMHSASPQTSQTTIHSLAGVWTRRPIRPCSIMWITT